MLLSIQNFATGVGKKGYSCTLGPPEFQQKENFSNINILEPVDNTYKNQETGTLVYRKKRATSVFSFLEPTIQKNKTMKNNQSVFPSKPSTPVFVQPDFIDHCCIENVTSNCTKKNARCNDHFRFCPIIPDKYSTFLYHKEGVADLCSTNASNVPFYSQYYKPNYSSADNGYGANCFIDKPGFIYNQNTASKLQEDNHNQPNKPNFINSFSSCECNRCVWKRILYNLPFIKLLVLCLSVCAKLVSSLFSFKYIYKYKDGPLVFCILLIIGHFIISLLIQLKYTALNFDLLLFRELYGLSFVIIMLYVFILTPPLLYQITFVTDAFGIKSDLISTFFVACPTYCIMLLWINVDFLQPVRNYIPVSLILIAGCSIIHSFLITGPLLSEVICDLSSGHHHPLPPPMIKLSHNLPRKQQLNVLSEQSQNHIVTMTKVKTETTHQMGHFFNSLSHLTTIHKCITSINGDSQNQFFSYPQPENELTLDKVLCDSALLAKFRKFTTTEFAVENLLFYEICQEYKQLLSTSFKNDDGYSALANSSSQRYQAPTSRNPRTIDPLFEPALQIYSKFIKSGSTYEININGHTKKRIDECINNYQIYGNLFDEALYEVAQLLTSWSLPRFSEWLSKNMEYDFSTNPF